MAMAWHAMAWHGMAWHGMAIEGFQQGVLDARPSYRVFIVSEILEISV